MDNNIKSTEENQNEEKNKKKEKLKNKELINEMEEYEKKLFINYLKNVNSIKKNNLMLRIKKRKNEKINRVNGESICLNSLNSLDANPVRSYFNQNSKKFSKYKNNFTLNEIILDFNPHNRESYKRITNPSPRNNKKFKNNNNIPAIKISPLIRKYNPLTFFHHLKYLYDKNKILLFLSYLNHHNYKNHIHHYFV